MKRRGAFENISLMIVAMIIAVSIAGIGIEKLYSMEEIVRKATLPIVGARIESSIYMLAAFEHARAEIKLGDEYGIERDEGTTFINYTLGDSFVLSQQPAHYEIDPRAPSSFSVKEGKKSKVCIWKKKQGKVILKAGGCG